MPVENKRPNYDSFAVQARLARSSLKKIIKEGRSELPQAGCQYLLNQLFVTFNNLYSSNLKERKESLFILFRRNRRQRADIAISMIVTNSNTFVVQTSRTNSKTGEEFELTALEFALDEERGWTSVGLKASQGTHTGLMVEQDLDGQGTHFRQVLAAGVRIARDLRWLL